MEMADSSESSDDASGKSSKQSADNTRRLKKKLKELQRKLETGKHRSASHRSKAKHNKKRKYKSGLIDESTSSGLLDESTSSSSDSTVARITHLIIPQKPRDVREKKGKVEKEAANRGKFTALLKTQAPVVLV